MSEHVHEHVEAKKIAVIAVITIVGSGVGYAVSPYFTESTIDEPMPQGVVVIPATVGDKKDDMDIGDDTMNVSMAMTPLVSYAGTFVGVGDGIHDAGGQAYTILLEDGSTVLRLEDFYSTNGPGLRVYLATDPTGSDYHSLGDLKANRGNQNYQIPDDIDLDRFDHVLIWCEPFSVLFGSAHLIAR